MQCRDRAVCGCFIRSAVNNSTSTTQTPAVATRKHQICPIFSPQKYCLKRLPWCLPVDSATCCSLWLWDWLLCFFPLRRLAEMETRNGSYLNDSISPNESMWEPLFLFFQYFPPSLPSIGLLCVWTCSVIFVLIGWFWQWLLICVISVILLFLTVLPFIKN